MHPDIHLAQARGRNPLEDFRNTTNSVEYIFSHQAATPGDVRRQLSDAIGNLNELEKETRHLDRDGRRDPNVFAELRQRLNRMSRDSRETEGTRREAATISTRLHGLEGHAGRLQSYLESTATYGLPRYHYEPTTPLTPFPCPLVPSQIGCPGRGPGPFDR